VPQHYAEHYGFLQTVNFFEQLEAKYPSGPNEVVFYDSQCGLPIYVAPRGRSYAEWKKESINHGWPSFRDQEVVHENVIAEAGYNAELVSKCNTHLGHNLPDSKGRRDCVNLMCMAGVQGAGNGSALPQRMVTDTKSASAEQIPKEAGYISEETTSRSSASTTTLYTGPRTQQGGSGLQPEDRGSPASTSSSSVRSCFRTSVIVAFVFLLATSS